MPLTDRINCGTLLALAGFGVFVILGIVLFQILCYGPGGVGGSSLMERWLP